MNGTYLCRHSHAAAYLLYAGLELIEANRKDNGFEFRFNDPENSGSELEANFWNDGTVSSAKQLLVANKEIQHRIHMLKIGVF